jgi:drug efflux transport system permease protein
MKPRRIRAVIRKEFLHVIRDPLSLMMALAVPLVMLSLFGYALSLDVDRIPTVIHDHDRTPQSRELIERFAGSRYFQVLGSDGAGGTIERKIDRGECLLGVVIPRDYARRLLNGEEAEIQLLLDGSEANTGSIALGYAEALLSAYQVELRTEALNRRGGGEMKTPVEPRLRVWYNSEMKSKHFIVPGLIAIILMIVGALLTTLTIAREWEMGTMEQLLSTPLRPAELVGGKMAAYFLIGVADLVIALVIGIFLFRVPFRGSLLLLIGACGVYLFGALCWGILISALMKSQLLAYQMGMLTSYLPTFMLSGYFFAIENMPAPIRFMTYFVPARYFITILKGIFMKGVGLEVLWLELACLIVFAVVVFLVATRQLKRKLG